MRIEPNGVNDLIDVMKSVDERIRRPSHINMSVFPAVRFFMSALAGRRIC